MIGRLKDILENKIVVPLKINNLCLETGLVVPIRRFSNSGWCKLRVNCVWIRNMYILHERASAERFEWISLDVAQRACMSEAVSECPTLGLGQVVSLLSNMTAGGQTAVSPR